MEPLFKANGELTDSFKQAGKLEGTEIVFSNGVRILNGQTYKVTASDTASDGKGRRIHRGGSRPGVS